jgi:DNA mismatch repair protein MutS
VFTRVGASDDIAGGQSTFMREMTELTEILRAATPDSLVLLDEVGRGTSTADGRAIARAAAEYVHDEVRAHALFATHYHDLTSLADERERVRNLHFAAERTGGGDGDATGGERVGVEFLHRVLDGPASSSYGIEVAHMAGVPAAVVERARELVADAADGADQPTLAAYADESEAGGVDGSTNGRTGDSTGDSTGGRDESARAAGVSTGAGAPEADERAAVLAELRDVELAGTTPLEALNILADLKGRLDP